MLFAVPLGQRPPSSPSSNPPGSARLFPTRGFDHVAFTTALINAADWPSLAVETAFPRSLVFRNLPRVTKTFRLSSTWRFIVRSLPLLSVLSLTSENRPACAVSSLRSALASLPCHPHVSDWPRRVLVCSLSSARSERSSVVFLPSLQSILPRRALPFLQHAALGKGPHCLVCTRAHNRCCGVIEHSVTYAMFPVIRSDEIDVHPQGLQRHRSTVRVVHPRFLSVWLPPTCSRVGCSSLRHLSCHRPCRSSGCTHALGASSHPRPILGAAYWTCPVGSAPLSGSLSSPQPQRERHLASRHAHIQIVGPGPSRLGFTRVLCVHRDVRPPQAARCQWIASPLVW